MSAAIKFAVLRTNDGHATDLLRPAATVREGVRGHLEILPQGRHTVTIDGTQAEGTPPRWPDDLKPGKRKVVISGHDCEVEVIGTSTEPAAEQVTDAADATAKHHKAKPKDSEATS